MESLVQEAQVSLVWFPICVVTADITALTLMGKVTVFDCWLAGKSTLPPWLSANYQPSKAVSNSGGCKGYSAICKIVQCYGLGIARDG